MTNTKLNPVDGAPAPQVDVELLPCPFCGSPAHFRDAGFNHVRVECTDWGQCVKLQRVHSDDTEHRIKLARHWNTRVGADAWQPIETAPKKTLIDVWVSWPDSDPERLGYAYYDNICGEWRTSRPSGHLRCVPERFVTHWRELPAPPLTGATASN